MTPFDKNKQADSEPEALLPLPLQLLLRFMPAWTRRVGLSRALENLDPRRFPAGPEYFPLDRCGALSLDAIYVSAADAPRGPRDAVPLFAKLDGGGVAIIEESRTGRGMRRALIEIGRGNGLDLRFFGPPAAASRAIRRGLQGRTGPAAVAVFAKPLVPGRDTERKALSIVLAAPDLSAPQVGSRIAAWRDFLLGQGLARTSELLLLADGPEAHRIVQNFAQEQLRDLRRDDALNVIAHYRELGIGRAIDSATVFARGDYLLWEDLSSPPTGRLEIPCEETMALLDAMWDLEAGYAGRSGRTACTVRPRPVRSDSRTGRRMGAVFRDRATVVPAFVLWNQSAARRLRLARPERIENIARGKGPGHTGQALVRVRHRPEVMPRLSAP